MSQKYYDLCCKHHGKFVRINDRHGKCYAGKIVKVTKTHVLIQSPRRNLGGIGYGYYGYRPRYGYRYNYYSIPLAFITGLALGRFFW